MPITFKPTKSITLVSQTPEEDLILCTACGGLQAMSQTALDLDCPVCDGTGWENLFSNTTVDASYRPGIVKRWNYISGAMDTLGECSIKIDYKYKSLLDNASYIVMNGQEWKFAFLRDPGEGMGQHRISLALSKK